MKVVIRVKGGEGSGFHGHAGRPGLVGGSSPGFQVYLIGKHTYGRHSPSLDRYGIPFDKKTGEPLKEVVDEFEKTKSISESQEKYFSEHPENPIFNYDAIDHTKSYASNHAGFPQDHPFYDDKKRLGWVNYGAQQLSYSNMVGFGGALKQASQGNTDSELYAHFSKELPQGVKLEDVIKAMHAETQGIIREGLPKSVRNLVNGFVLYHGTSSFGGGRKEVKLVDVSSIYSGISSWTSSEWQANTFGSHTIMAKIPFGRILSIPGLMPKQLSGVPSFLGGGRDEREFIVLSDNIAKILGIYD